MMEKVNNGSNFTRQNINIPATFLGILVINIVLILLISYAGVVKIEIKNREVVSTSPEHIRYSPYEVIKGIIYMEVDPDMPPLK
jgi:hypothetical protein